MHGLKGKVAIVTGGDSGIGRATAVLFAREGANVLLGARRIERINAIAEECRKLGIDRVLMVCDKENIGSAKSIINNGGVLENEVIVDSVTEQRYWIQL